MNNESASISTLSPEHREKVRSMLEQLLIVFVKRAGGSISIPAAEIDNTSQDLLAFKIDPDTREFIFTALKKN